MDTALQALLSWNLLLFALGMFAIVWFIRTALESIFPKLAKVTIWENLILPAMPSIFGAIIAYFVKSYAYPDGLISTSDRIIFGCVAGMFSGLVYQVVKGMLKGTIQSYINGNLPPAPPPPPPPQTPPAPTNLMGSGPTSP
jgi:hypothetical protein